MLETFLDFFFCVFHIPSLLQVLSIRVELLGHEVHTYLALLGYSNLLPTVGELG